MSSPASFTNDSLLEIMAVIIPDEPLETQQDLNIHGRKTAIMNDWTCIPIRYNPG
jgi:hypothetical protein